MDSIIKCIEKSKILILIALFFICCTVKSQVDQKWLHNWNVAIKNKPSEIRSRGRIAPVDEKGKPLVIKGNVFNPDNTPAKAVLVHSYHRDSEGYDFGKNDSELSTWRLHGWAKTDQNGNFEFKTIRPAADYIAREGPHIHFTLVSEKYGRQ
ncbi:MAG: hypothetical protein AAGF96_17930 [Bacteroidota bacterium]